MAENEYDSIVVYTNKDLSTIRRLSGYLRHRGIKDFKKVNRNTFVIPRDENKSLDSQISELKASNLFSIVEPNYKLSVDSINIKEKDYKEISIREPDNGSISEQREQSVIPNDEWFSYQYYLRQINAHKAWNVTVGDSLLVAVLDTGVDANHPDLQGKVIGRKGKELEDLSDSISHGTGVAGLIAAHTNNTEGIAGIAWNTKILSIRITDEFGQARVSDVVAALEDVYNHGAKIAQISLSTNQYSRALEEAIKLAHERGILIVSSGGNSGTNEIRYPADFEDVLGVGAVNKSSEVEDYSTKGEHIKIVAPGSSIYTTSSILGYENQSGTSFAAPQVAGAAALVWSIIPDITYKEVMNILTLSARDLGEEGKDTKYGHGLLNIKGAVNLAKEIASSNKEKEVIKSWVTR